MVMHKFGGEWTEDKLDKINRYFKAYTTALKNQKFTTWYIDGFAGTGTATIGKTESKNLSFTLNNDAEYKEIPGSALLSLETVPVFDKYFFIDLKKKHSTALHDLVNEYPNLDTTILQEDANDAIKRLCSAVEKQWNNRGIIFLDPYGMEVCWSTIQAIANTQKLDLWYLFPVEGTNRQVPNELNNIDESKCRILNKIYGTNDWINASYGISTPDLFEETKSEKIINKEGLENFMKERLNEIFPYVSKPYRLYRDSHLKFSLFFCVSNPEPKAIGLAQKLANSILKQ